jgi:hypothetical protein
MHVLTNIPFELDAEALMDSLQIPAEGEMADSLHNLVALAGEHGNPKALYGEVYVTERDGDTLQAGPVTFTSRALVRNTAESERLFPFVSTCGHEMDEVFDAKGDFILEFWWDAIKAEMLLAANHYLNTRMRSQYRLGKTATMSPGSGDATVWPIEQQRELFELLGGVRDDIGVTLTDSCLMLPNKTVSGVVFLTQKDYQACEVCHRVDCVGRRAPFNQTLWEELQAD